MGGLLEKWKKSQSIVSKKYKVFVSHPFTANPVDNYEDAVSVCAKLEERFPEYVFYNPLEIFKPMGGACPEDVILAACFNIILHCDAVFQCDGWQESAGCRGESAFARVHTIPCVCSMEELAVFCDGETVAGDNDLQEKCEPSLM